MLSDRPYMRDNHGRASFPALAWLICAIAGGYVVENISRLLFSESVDAGLLRLLTLSFDGITSGFVWTLATHALIHDPHSLLHLVLTLLALYVFGRAVVAEIGAKHLLAVFIAAVVSGGVAWLAVNGAQGGQLYGASAGVSALIVLFACLAPNQPITFFLIDIGMRAKHLAIGLLVLEVLGLVLMEIPGRGSWFAMSHSAHLGGMLAGWLYFRYFHRRDWLDSDEKPAIELPQWLRKARKAETPAPSFKVDISSAEEMRAEIDRILDKINSEGFQSLTAEEKHRLDHARDHLSRR
ncbi:MAG: Rhomboid family protein [Rariglobus sp.]|jgi:membrane associated rhomboid family serine protease|nr:Rhomboid family protein [Rariglobus sp.]